MTTDFELGYSMGLHRMWEVLTADIREANDQGWPEFISTAHLYQVKERLEREGHRA